MPYLTEREMIVLAPVACGEVSALNASATQFPAIACAYVMIKALSGNNGNVFVGLSTVTVSDNTTDVTTGFELDAGQEITIPLKNGNSNILYLIGSATGANTISYLALG